MISEIIKQVKNRIADAAEKSGRNPQSIRLVAVSKGVSFEKITEAGNCGHQLFGENKVQEAMEKIERLGRGFYRWHFIGHLQKNKVKFVVDQFDLIHSIDSAALAEAVHKKSCEHDTVTPVLIQVNVSGEESKFGVDPGNLKETLQKVSGMRGVRVEGLMTIPPWDPDPENSRTYFSVLRTLRDDMVKLGMDHIALDELSMGMSHDFHVAIEEGATLVRVGTAIFGPRETTG